MSLRGAGYNWFQGRKKKSFASSAGKLRFEKAELGRLRTQIKEKELSAQLRGEQAKLRRLQHPHLYSLGGAAKSQGLSLGKGVASYMWGTTPRTHRHKRRHRGTHKRRPRRRVVEY